MLLEKKMNKRLKSNNQCKEWQRFGKRMLSIRTGFINVFGKIVAATFGKRHSVLYNGMRHERIFMKQPSL